MFVDEPLTRGVSDTIDKQFVEDIPKIMIAEIVLLVGV